MPIYEYRCGGGHAFEVIQRMSDDPMEKCEVCGKPASRVFHPPAVHFKGSGFYNTDYGTRKRAREKEAASAEGKADGAQNGAKAGSDSSSKSSTESAKSSSESAAGKSEAKAA